MARVSFTVDYTQGATGVGQISLTAGGGPQVVDASGRLDKVGDMVFAVVQPPPPALGGNAVDIECTRTSSHTMRVVVRLKATFSQTYVTSPFLERVIENVPLSFTP